jgi:hypothetical protein
VPLGRSDSVTCDITPTALWHPCRKIQRGGRPGCPESGGHALLNVLPVMQHVTAEYAHLRQTTRSNNADVVAEGAVKPTSVYSVTRIENSLVAVAHLSEAVPRDALRNPAPAP